MYITNTHIHTSKHTCVHFICMQHTAIDVVILLYPLMCCQSNGLCHLAKLSTHASGVVSTLWNTKLHSSDPCPCSPQQSATNLYTLSMPRHMSMCIKELIDVCVHVLKSKCWDLCSLGSHAVRELTLEQRRATIVAVRERLRIAEGHYSGQAGWHNINA